MNTMIPRRGLAALCGLGLAATPSWADVLHLQAKDGVAITGFFTPVAGAKAVVLLFHMAGSNAGEYTPIAARLAKEGYASLAIDQRSGGRGFGRDNETARRASGGFDSALADLEAALVWARVNQPGRKIVVIGSSYSAALVFLLANAHPSEIAAVLAFSPGEYLAASVRKAASGVAVPVFVTSARDAGEEQAAAAILAASPAKVKMQYRAVAGGVHGASSLRADANPSGAEPAFQAVLSFLNTVTG